MRHLVQSEQRTVGNKRVNQNLSVIKIEGTHALMELHPTKVSSVIYTAIDMICHDTSQKKGGVQCLDKNGST